MIDRRSLLRAAGIISAGALVDCVAPPSASSPQPALSPAATPPTPAPTPAPTPRTADWSALARSLRGALVRPGDAAYDAARLLYNTRFDGIRPQGIARCESTDDVRACVAFATQTGLPVAIRSGGHSYGGWSTGRGLVIDTGPLSSVQISPDRAVIGAGARLIDVYAALAAAGAGIPGGSCATVGIGGLTLGGGVGVMSRLWGLTCDNLVSAEVVTADGRALVCDEQREPDLFWALRGGGGSFGVVTSFVFRTHATGDLALGFLSWPWSAASTVIAAWQAWQRQATAALWSNLHLDADPSGATLTLYAVHAGGTAALRAALDGLDTATGIRAGRTTRTSSFAEVMLLDAGCAGLTAAQCHLAGQTPDGKLGRETYAATSIVALDPLSAGAIDTLVKGIAALPQGTAGSVIYDALGGAVAGVAPEATPFPHRAALGVLQFIVNWSDPARETEAGAWLRAYRAAVTARSSNAAYANYADPDFAGWPQAYYGLNYPRLQRVKRVYDPTNVFSFPQAIAPS